MFCKPGIEVSTLEIKTAVKLSHLIIKISLNKSPNRLRNQATLGTLYIFKSVRKREFLNSDTFCITLKTSLENPQIMCSLLKMILLQTAERECYAYGTKSKNVQAFKVTTADLLIKQAKVRRISFITIQVTFTTNFNYVLCGMIITKLAPIECMHYIT